MGIFKISGSSDDQTIYVLYQIKEQEPEVKIYTLDENEISFYLKINNDSDIIQKWAQNLQQTTENYLLQLCAALKEQLHQNLNSMEASNDCTDLKNESSKQNIFEINGGILIWKQFFESKNVYGKKGKFQLEEKARDDVLPLVMDALMKELIEKDNRVHHLEKENKSLVKEKEELSKIAEKSVALKENFEKEIYGKFSSILNKKKEKNLELQNQLTKIHKNGKTPSANAASTSNIKEFDMSEDEYEVDTDVDSPDEVEVEGSASNSTLKRRDNQPRSLNEGEPKKSRTIDLETSDDSQSSQDLLNASLESDFRSIGFSRKNIRRII